MKTFEDLEKVLKILRMTDLSYDVEWICPGEIYVTFDMGDVFWWGCSDSENIEAEDIPLLEKCVADAGEDEDFDIELLFICRKRKMRPQGCVLRLGNPVHKIIMNEFPPRPIDLGNPYDTEGNYLYNRTKTDEI